VNAGRVRAVFKRHLYMTLTSPPRIFDWLFWPAIDIMLWGFLTTFLRQQGAKLPVPIGFLLGGFLLWDMVFRSENGIALAFLDETWSRNVLNILASPVTPTEYTAGAMLWGLSRMAVGWSIIATQAWLVFSFAPSAYGPALILFAGALLLFAVALAMLVLGLVLRFGNGATILAWGATAFFMPLSAVFYPVSVLPGWARAISGLLPTAQVFESMRTVIGGGAIPWDRLARAFALDAAFLLGAFWFARAMFATLRRRGYITRFM